MSNNGPKKWYFCCTRLRDCNQWESVWIGNDNKTILTIFRWFAMISPNLNGLSVGQVGSIVFRVKLTVDTTDSVSSALLIFICDCIIRLNACKRTWVASNASASESCSIQIPNNQNKCQKSSLEDSFLCEKFLKRISFLISLSLTFFHWFAK